MPIGDDVFVFVKDDAGNLTKHDTCFNFQTVGQQLTEIGVDWAYYSAAPGQVGYFWNAYNGIGNVFHTDLWRSSTCGRSTASCATSRPGAPLGHVGDAEVRALGPSAALDGLTRTTGSATS